MRYSDLWSDKTPLERAKDNLDEEKRKAKKVKMSENDVKEISSENHYSYSRDLILHNQGVQNEIKALRREIKSITLWSLIKKIWS